MTVITIPATGHDHLADALVRDLGFVRLHADADIRARLLELDPIVTSDVTLANMRPGPRLSSKLETSGGDTLDVQWDIVLNPPRPGASPDRVAAEVRRMLDVLRGWFPVGADADGDAVVVGAKFPTVAIEGRYDGVAAHWIQPGGIVGEQAAVVDFVRSLNVPTAAPITRWDKVDDSTAPASIFVEAVLGTQRPSAPNDVEKEPA